MGQAVSVVQGALKGLEGIVATVRNRDRLIVSVALLQRSVAIEIDREWVKPLDPAQLGPKKSRVASVN